MNADIITARHIFYDRPMIFHQLNSRSNRSRGRRDADDGKKHNLIGNKKVVQQQEFLN